MASLTEQKGSTAMVVDDVEDNRNVYRMLLLACGFTDVKTAASYEEAIEIVSRATANLSLILLDVHIYEGSGIDLCCELRKFPRSSGAVIAIVSAFGDEKLRAAAKTAGANAYILKPLNQEKLELLRPYLLLSG